MSPISPTPTPRWTDSLLDAMRQTQDRLPTRSSTTSSPLETFSSVYPLMRTLVANDGLPPAQLPPVVRDYLARTGQPPEWADSAKIVAGERVFWRYGPAIIGILNCYSLPFCYAGRKGVQVLALTSRLYTNPTRRIIETAQMVVDVMRPGGLGQLGTGLRTAQKVRLMHAGVCFRIAHYPGWKPEFDLPINQEDMAGALLSFSCLILDGLRRLGYRLTNEEIEAYLHCWNVVGHVMGIRPEMLTLDYPDAAALNARIAERQFAACDEGQLMTRALIDMMRHSIPGNLFDRAPELLMRYLLGDRTSDILAVQQGHIADLLTGPIRLLARVKSDLVHCSDEIHGILLLGRGGHRVPFDIPTELLQTWGVNWKP